MNILMLGWELPPHNSGGLGIACYHLSKAIAKNGAHIDFVLPYFADHSNVDYMDIHSVTSLSPIDRYGMGAYDSSIYLGQDDLEAADENDLSSMRGLQKRYVRYIQNFVSNHDVDVIHAHDWLTMEAGVRAKQIINKPLVIHVHATEYDRSGELPGNPLVHDIERNALMMADKIFAVSNMTKGIIVQNYGIPADNIEVVRNALDVESFDPNYCYDDVTYRYLESLKTEGYTVVSTVTRFTVQKGLIHLMRAAAKVCRYYEKVVFLFAGDGEQRDELIQLAARYGISDKVYFTGFVRGKRWRDAYSVADVFVMSSVSEPFGLTALEAAHHDNALIISKQSGVSEVLNSIFRYDFWDSDLLADQIIGLSTSEALLGEMRSNIKSEYSNISWDDVGKRCLSLYTGIRKGASI